MIILVLASRDRSAQKSRLDDACLGERPYARAFSVYRPSTRTGRTHAYGTDTEGLGGTPEPVQDGLLGHSGTRRDDRRRLPKPRAHVRFMPGALRGRYLTGAMLAIGPAIGRGETD
ncbi:MAG: hypothetical protein ACRDL7_01465 [Gaiellaceae bacterium]